MHDASITGGAAMIAIRAAVAGRVAITIALAAALALASADAAELAFDAATGRVEARGLDPAEVRALAAGHGTMARALAVRTVFDDASPDVAEPPPIVGHYALDGMALVFVPRHGWHAGRRYRAAWAAPAGARAPGVPRTATLAFRTPSADASGATPTVTAILPTGPVLPANLLRVHVRFSRPMRRGHAADAVRLEGADGRTLPSSFLAIGHELWSEDMRRLTLTLDPGRIKRGVRPNLEAGAPLVGGHAYTLVVGATLKARDGTPLGFDVRRRFIAGPALADHPPLDAWRVGRVGSGTRQSLAIEPPASIDLLSAELRLAIVDADGQRLPGRLRGAGTDGSLLFAPERPWEDGARLRLDPRLEDISGNRRGSAFEMPPGTAAASGSRMPVAFLPIDVH